MPARRKRARGVNGELGSTVSSHERPTVQTSGAPVYGTLEIIFVWLGDQHIKGHLGSLRFCSEPFTLKSN